MAEAVPAGNCWTAVCEVNERRGRRNSSRRVEVGLDHPLVTAVWEELRETSVRIRPSSYFFADVEELGRWWSGG